ncbi:hypothetical protein ACFQ3Z_25005 [Streptomyces nogalater]
MSRLSVLGWEPVIVRLLLVTVGRWKRVHPWDLVVPTCSHSSPPRAGVPER